MPCPPRMRGCRADCLHRKLVLEYRDARDAYDAELEAATSMYPTEVLEYKAARPGVTFKLWLEQSAGARRDPHA